MTSRRSFIKNIAGTSLAGTLPLSGFDVFCDKPAVTYKFVDKHYLENNDVPSLNELELFDSCITFGKFISNYSIDSTSELESIMDRYYIKEALVHDFHSRSEYPIENGNFLLSSAIQGHPRLHPVWILEPPIIPGLSPSVKLIDEMMANGVKVARLRFNNKNLFSWMWEDLFSVLEHHRIPCFLDFGTSSSTISILTNHDVDNLKRVIDKFPKLPLILSHVVGGLGINPAALYLIYRSENLYLDITGVLEFWRNIAYDIGPERILFATGMPFCDPGILVSNVQYTLDLNKKEKKMICGDNLRRLIMDIR